MSTDLVKFAIVGRPNVGKSTLFNVLTGRRKSVVQDRAGVTRDLIISEASAFERNFELIDTGGVTDAADEISQLIKRRVKDVLDEVDHVIVVCDGRQGVTSEDRELIQLVNTSGRDAIVVANKIDRVEDETTHAAEFYEFGMDVIGASIEQRRGVSDILEWIYPRCNEEDLLDPEEVPKIAIVGKPNVGKSSLLNHLAGEERSLVSTIAGTTIDSIDAKVEINDRPYLLIDTAGLRRRSRVHDDLETLSSIMSTKSLKRADLVLLVIDVTEGPTDQDARIMQTVMENHKGVMIVANKADIGKAEIPAFRKEFRAKCERVFHFFPDIWIQFVSAKTGAGIHELFEKINLYQGKLDFRISTRELNDFFTNVIREAPAPLFGTKTVKFFYLTQTKQRPPSFIAFANHPRGVNPSYRRFLSKRIQKQWDLQGVPIRIFVMKKGRKLDG